MDIPFQYSVEVRPRVSWPIQAPEKQHTIVTTRHALLESAIQTEFLSCLMGARVLCQNVHVQRYSKDR